MYIRSKYLNSCRTFPRPLKKRKSFDYINLRTKKKLKNEKFVLCERNGKRATRFMCHNSQFDVKETLDL